MTDTLFEYIHKYHAPAYIKQLLYKELCALFDAIGKKYNITDYSDYLEDLPEPIEEDVTIDLIKELHKRDGITKGEFAYKHHVDVRTVQNKIHALNRNRKQPLRIGGQAVYIPVKPVNVARKRDEEQRYYTPDTLSPVVFQMNITQAATMLQSFYYNNQKGNIIPFDMAIDMWGQLSKYARKRIRDVFCKNDQEFTAFIDEVDCESESISYRFMTESKMLAERDTSAREQLNLAYKSSRICDITLKNPVRTRKNQLVLCDYEMNKYYAVEADNINGERLYFEEEELDYLVEQT